MSYATIEEAWGQDFNRKKKSKRDKRQEKLGKQIADESVDPEIIPKMSDERKEYIPQKPMIPNLDSFNGYDRFTNRYGSPYQTSNNTLNVSSNDILENNRKIEQQYNNAMLESNVPSELSVVEKKIEDIENKVVQITEDKYKQLTEGFTNQSDEQFNQLLLYIFTGIFYLFMLDLMYQLGKKSY